MLGLLIGDEEPSLGWILRVIICNISSLLLRSLEGKRKVEVKYLNKQDVWINERECLVLLPPSRHSIRVVSYC